MDDPSISDGHIDLMHQPGMVIIMIGLLLLCVFSTIVNLRNGRLWMLRLAGVATSGVVDALEYVTEANGEVLRRPRVRYTTQDGVPVRAVPLVFRATSTIAIGTTVRLSYAAERPERMVVHGFDVRLREPVYAVASLAVAISLALVYVLA
jgi:hypothetical protein